MRKSNPNYVNPFFEAKRLERLAKRAETKRKPSSPRLVAGELARIPGYESLYSLRSDMEPNKVAVYVKYEGHSKWTLDDLYDSMAKALSYVHECLAYEMEVFKPVTRVQQIDSSTDGVANGFGNLETA